MTEPTRDVYELLRECLECLAPTNEADLRAQVIAALAARPEPIGWARLSQIYPGEKPSDEWLVREKHPLNKPFPNDRFVQVWEAPPAPALIAKLKADHADEYEQHCQQAADDAKKIAEQAAEIERLTEQLKTALFERNMSIGQPLTHALERAEAAEAALAQHTESHRWNIDETEAGIRICKGEHAKDVPCEYVEYVEAENAGQIKAQALRDLIERFDREWIGPPPIKADVAGWIFRVASEHERGT